jgi:hypothetical protein
VRTKLVTRVIQTNHLCSVKGREPFLHFDHPRMYLNLNDHGLSHNFEQTIFGFHGLKAGDDLVLQWCKVTQVPMTKFEIMLQWFRGLIP